MILLRRVLTAGALVLFVPAGPLIVAPGPILEGLLGQAPIVDPVWVRLFGVAGIVLAMIHVLILRKLDELWWWCWALVVFDALSALIVLLHAAAGLREGAAAWPWWLYGVTSAAFAALYLVGIAKAGQERPIA
jgi:hypothetical protein